MKKIIVIILVIVSGIAAGASAADCITNWNYLKAFQRGWPENSFREFAKLAAKWGQADLSCLREEKYRTLQMRYWQVRIMQGTDNPWTQWALLDGWNIYSEYPEIRREVFKASKNNEKFKTLLRIHDR